MNNKYKMIKVFDCQDMPDDLRKKFFDYSESVGNDCYITWYMDEYFYDLEARETDGELEEYEIISNEISEWFTSNGANFKDKEILIKHWW